MARGGKLARVELPPDVAELLRVAVQGARRPATWRAYAADWRTFARWCEGKGQPAIPAPAELVAWYVLQLAEGGKAYSTIARALAAISVVHTRSNQPSPRAAVVVRDMMQAIRRSIHVAPKHAKSALTVAELRRVVTALQESDRVLASLRDRAILVFGFAGGFRRSELAALDVGDLATREHGIEVTIRTSKTDPDGAGRTIGIPFGSDRFTCPVRAVRAWIEGSGLREGALFRQLGQRGERGERMSARAIGEVVKRAVRAAGLDPARYGGHSLRAGLCTAAAQAGKSAAAIMAQTGHRSAAIVMRYVRAAGLFDDNAASGIGL